MKSHDAVIAGWLAVMKTKDFAPKEIYAEVAGKVKLEPTYLRAWVSVLSKYPVENVNLAFQRYFADDRRFPDVSDIAKRCQSMSRSAEHQVYRGPKSLPEAPQTPEDKLKRREELRRFWESRAEEGHPLAMKRLEDFLEVSE